MQVHCAQQPDNVEATGTDPVEEQSPKACGELCRARGGEFAFSCYFGSLLLPRCYSVLVKDGIAGGQNVVVEPGCTDRCALEVWISDWRSRWLKESQLLSSHYQARSTCHVLGRKRRSATHRAGRRDELMFQVGAVA